MPLPCNPSNANAGAAIAPAIVVQVQDAAGIPVTISTAQVDMAIGSNPSGGTLGGTASISASGGIATFSTLSINKGGPGYTLTASSAGLASATSNPFNIIPVPVLVSASSRKTHGAAGSFDLALSLVPTAPSIEPRIGPNHTLVLTFDTPVTGGTLSVTEGTATVGTLTFSGNELVVPLTNVPDKQYVTVTVSSMTSGDGATGGGGSARVGFLKGDVNQNRVVTFGDVFAVNGVLGQPVTAVNFLKDVNVNGLLTFGDNFAVNNQTGNVLPAP